MAQPACPQAGSNRDFHTRVVVLDTGIGWRVLLDDEPSGWSSLGEAAMVAELNTETFERTVRGYLANRRIALSVALDILQDGEAGTRPFFDAAHGNTMATHYLRCFVSPVTD